MKIIPVKTPKLLKKLYPNYTWDFYKEGKKKIYLTFDDGPIPEVTEFVLDQLKAYNNAKATFFCIGKNIKKYPEIFNKIITDGHAIGNHTMDHLKAWGNDLTSYLENTASCQNMITKQVSVKNKLFRPPYGHISSSKLSALEQFEYQIVLWDILAKDWSLKITPEKCAENVINNAKSGSIVVLHDSIKAYKNLHFALPKILNHFSEKGYIFEKI